MRKFNIDDETARAIVEELKRGGVTCSDVARKYKIHVGTIQRLFVKATGVAYTFYRKQFNNDKIKDIQEYNKAHPTESYTVLAKRFNVPIATVCKALKGFNRTEKIYKEIQAVVKSRPLATFDWFVKTTKRGYAQVVEAIRALEREGWYLDLEREILIADFFESNPNATNSDAAAHFGVNPQFVYAIIHKAEKEEREEDDDRRWGAACIPPPVRIQRDIERMRGFGVMLPPESMDRYVELHNKKRR